MADSITLTLKNGTVEIWCEDPELIRKEFALYISTPGVQARMSVEQFELLALSDLFRRIAER